VPENHFLFQSSLLGSLEQVDFLLKLELFQHRRAIVGGFAACIYADVIHFFPLVAHSTRGGMEPPCMILRTSI
jgi:hypothetical protein